MPRTTLLHVTDLHFRKDHYAFVSRFAERTHCGVVISGDLIDSAAFHATIEQQIAWVGNWVRAATFPLFICGGNHDIDGTEAGSTELRAGWLLNLSRAGVVVDGQSGRFAGVEVACAPYMADFGLNYIGADILVHHEPPYQSLTAGGEAEGTQAGSVDLERYFQTVRALPHRLLLCGHAHRPRRWHDMVGGTLCVNPGSDRSSRVPRHALANVDTGTVRVSGERGLARF